MSNVPMDGPIKVIITIQAGLIPNEPMPEFSRQITITAEGWEAAGGLETMKAYGFAQEYMRSLWNPRAFNWVRCDWIYV